MDDLTYYKDFCLGYDAEPIDRTWVFGYKPVESTFHVDNIELVKDKVIYSTARQIRELEAIQEEINELLQQFRHVNSWFKDISEYIDQGGDL